MKKKVGTSLMEKIMLWILIICNGMIISYGSHKIFTALIVIGLSFVILSLYNLIKEIEAYYYHLENIKRSFLVSLILFIFGFLCSAIPVLILYLNNVLIICMYFLFHVLIVFLSVPLITLNRKIKQDKQNID